jgi:hypothetical protein
MIGTVLSLPTIESKLNELLEQQVPCFDLFAPFVDATIIYEAYGYQNASLCMGLADA